MSPLAPRDIVLGSLFTVGLWACFLNCTKQQGTQIASAAVTIAADVCKEVETQPEPDWVYIVCDIASGVQQTFRLPKKQWTAMKAASADAAGH